MQKLDVTDSPVIEKLPQEDIVERPSVIKIPKKEDIRLKKLFIKMVRIFINKFLI